METIKVIVRATELNNKNIYKLKIGQACVTNWGSFIIKNWRNRYYKIGQLLQIGAKFITNWGRYYKLGQLLQIRV